MRYEVIGGSHASREFGAIHDHGVYLAGEDVRNVEQGIADGAGTGLADDEEIDVARSHGRARGDRTEDEGDVDVQFAEPSSQDVDEAVGFQDQRMDLGKDRMVTVGPVVQSIAAASGYDEPLFVELFDLGPHGRLGEATSTGHFSDMEFIVAQAEKQLEDGGLGLRGDYVGEQH